MNESKVKRMLLAGLAMLVVWIAVEILVEENPPTAASLSVRSILKRLAAVRLRSCVSTMIETIQMNEHARQARNVRARHRTADNFSRSDSTNTRITRS